MDIHINTIFGIQAGNVPDDDYVIFSDTSKWRVKEIHGYIDFLLNFTTMQPRNTIMVSVTVNLKRLSYVLSRSRNNELIRVYEVYVSRYWDSTRPVAVPSVAWDVNTLLTRSAVLPLKNPLQQLSLWRCSWLLIFYKKKTGAENDSAESHIHSGSSVCQG